MTKESIYEREDMLMTVYRWSKRTGKGLSIGQRICISQERAALMSCINQLNENPDAKIVRRYKLPAHLDQKVQHLYQVAKREEVPS